MPFDIIAWGLGYGLTMIGNNVIQKLVPSKLQIRIKQEARDWCNTLPPEASDIVPEALLEKLFSQSSEAVTQEEFPHRVALGNQLRAYKVPTREQWCAALIERWEEVRSQLGDDAQQFFLLEQTVAESLLDQLAERLERAYLMEPNFFNVTVYSCLCQIDDKFASFIAKESISAPPEKVPQVKDRQILFIQNNAMGHNVVRGSSLQVDGLFSVLLMFYLKLLANNTLRRIKLEYLVYNSEVIYPVYDYKLAVDGQLWPVSVNGIMDPLVEFISDRWYSIAFLTRLWGLDLGGKIVYPSHPRFHDQFPPQDGTDYGNGKIVFEFMESSFAQQFWLNPGGEMLLTENQWIGPKGLIG